MIHDGREIEEEARGEGRRRYCDQRPAGERHNVGVSVESVAREMFSATKTWLLGFPAREAGTGGKLNPL